MSDHKPRHDIVQLSSAMFLAGCAALAAALVAFGAAPPPWVIAAEVLATVVSLFVLGSIRYRLDKNALTYGAALVIVASFWNGWWPGSALRADVASRGGAAAWDFVRHNFLTLHGLDQLVHADTMLFILGLTFFVGVIAQTRLLETVSFAVLKSNRGRVVPTVIVLVALVSFASGILDGVSMIGLMIWTLVIILFLSKINGGAVVYTVMVSTVVTTVCGMWLAYGEPPNLIMKANLHPLLDDAFFLRYCLPGALGAMVIVAFNVSRRFQGRRVVMSELDLLDRNTADVRFMQAARHGEVFTALEFAEDHEKDLGEHFKPVVARLQKGEPLGESLLHERVAKPVRLKLLGRYLSEDLAETVDDYYEHVYGKNDHKADESAVRLGSQIHEFRKRRKKAQAVGLLSFFPFVGLLVAHAINHDIPLFVASCAGFFVAFPAVAGIPLMRRLALREAAHEYREYLFLFPLFLSITLLQKTGFFVVIADGLRAAIERFGEAHVAYGQFWFCTVLSALLDNNVVADFAGRALKGLDTTLVHLFALAQIAGYALGGCWTHIGSAQSVVAYSYIQKELEPRYTPLQWIKAMTPVIAEIAVWMSIVVYGAAWLQSKGILG
jgi:Na+/H+ antiporter NhaD/arsenite permease-like protein